MLKIYIIEDDLSVANKVRSLLIKAYQNPEWLKYFEGACVKEDQIELIRGSRERIIDGKEHLFYEKDKILNTLTQIVNRREETETIGICMDITLTEEENLRMPNDSISYIARELYQLQGDKVYIVPMTGFNRFDEKSLGIIGESVEDKFLNKNLLGNNGFLKDILIFPLAYFLFHGKKPTAETIDEIAARKD